MFNHGDVVKICKVSSDNYGKMGTVEEYKANGKFLVLVENVGYRQYSACDLIRNTKAPIVLSKTNLSKQVKALNDLVDAIDVFSNAISSTFADIKKTLVEIRSNLKK